MKNETSSLSSFPEDADDGIKFERGCLGELESFLYAKWTEIGSLLKNIYPALVNWKFHAQLFLCKITEGKLYETGYMQTSALNEWFC